MASISVPCPKCSVMGPHGGRCPSSSQQPPSPAILILKKPQTHLIAGSARFPPLQQGCNRNKSLSLKAQAKEVAVEDSSNSSPAKLTKSEPLSSDSKIADKASEAAVQDSTISAFMAEVTNLIKLVDSKDITELELKRNDCELIIRKKEAIPQLLPPAPVMMQPPQMMFPTQPAVPHAAPPTSSGPPPAAQPPALPPAVKAASKSSLPSLKCPMAGTFYRCPAPGEPPFVKVGDKVKKGQVVCIIEAMKLMNEIEADQSGTVVEILAEDGKPVSVDMPLLLIQP